MGAFVLTAGLTAEATGGQIVSGAPDRVFDAVSTDSRTIASGALFIALRGEQFDGHAFAAQAVERGAAGLLVDRHADRTGWPAGPATVVVPDTLAALQQLGRETRRRSGARVIAITGSAGKTSTKEMTAELLSERFDVFRNAGNLNNHIGLPLSLLELRHGPDVAVVELGMNHAGEIRTLIGLAEPETRVWTNVGDAHVGFLGSREQIADAKAEILEAAPSGALLVWNADDPLVTRHAARWSGRALTFGTSERADVKASAIRDFGFDGTETDVETPAGRMNIRVPLPGRGQLWNALAAIAVGVGFDVPIASMPGRIAGFRPVGRRGAVVSLPGGARLVDDSYNASPSAVRMMLEALAATPAAGKRIAVLGEMLELGGSTVALHEACGRAAAESGVAHLVVIGGPDADGLAAGAIAAGLDGSRVHRYTDSAQAAEPVAALVDSGDLVLVKGSRGTRTDIVADRLQEAG